eukprot:5675308-Pyramimonas_sp.AAC.1
MDGVQRALGVEFVGETSGQVARFPFPWVCLSNTASRKTVSGSQHTTARFLGRRVAFPAPTL